MNRRSMSRRRRGAMMLAAVLLVGCGETYVVTSLLDDADATTTSTDTGEPATATDAPSTAGESDTSERSTVIARIDDALDRLSGAVADDAELAAGLLAGIEADWAAIEAGIRADHPTELFGMQQAIDLARSAVTRKRPADASKAWKIVRDLTPMLG